MRLTRILEQDSSGDVSPLGHWLGWARNVIAGILRRPRHGSACGYPSRDVALRLRLQRHGLSGRLTRHGASIVPRLRRLKRQLKLKLKL
eukprot:6638105-Alexandrium_andersonii.AAC.1